MAIRNLGVPSGKPVRGSPLNILYLGYDHGTSRHRAQSLSRLGHSVEVIDPWGFLPGGEALRRVFGKLVYELGPAWLGPYVGRRLLRELLDRHFDVVWNDQCELIGPANAHLLKQHSDLMVTYAIDDPFGKRDGKRFASYRESVRYYNLTVVVRLPNVDEALEHGAQEVLRVYRSADEIAHQALSLSLQEEDRWSSDVAFIGTWMPERGPLLARLLEMGLPLTLYGDRWQKACEWPALEKAWRGPGLEGKDYVKAVQSAKVCLGLLSKGNRDLHTSRSAEIPFIGSAFCAERTAEHLTMYQEDKEAVFWSSPEECAEKCVALLSDKGRREKIAKAGQERCVRSGYLNEPVMEKILATLFSRSRVPVPHFIRPQFEHRTR